MSEVSFKKTNNFDGVEERGIDAVEGEGQVLIMFIGQRQPILMLWRTQLAEEGSQEGVTGLFCIIIGGKRYVME